MTLTPLGGWRLAEPFGGGGLNGGGLAIDFTGKVLYCYVNNPTAGRVGVAIFDLPEPGTGTDPAQWPVLYAKDFLPGWWDYDNPEYSQGPFCQGLRWGEGKLWAVTRDFYPVVPADTVVVKAVDGTRKVYGSLGLAFGGVGRQAFGNFVKGPNGTFRLGCGGHETGQGTVNGPCLAELDGTVRIIYASLPWDVGESLENWNRVAPRPPDYWPVNHVDTWLAWEPRDTDGDGRVEGRWAADHVDSGGLTLPDGVYFWTFQGIGEKDYLHQHESASPVFADSWANHRTRVYRYDPATYQLLEYADWPGDNGEPMRNPIRGSELGPDGKVYLLEGYAWRESGDDNVNPTVRVYDLGGVPIPPPPPDPGPEPEPVPLEVSLSVAPDALRAGVPFSLSTPTGETLVVELGDGTPPFVWGQSRPPAYRNAGAYTATVWNGDLSRETTIPVQVGGPLVFEVSKPRVIAAPPQPAADNHIGCAHHPDEPGGNNLYYYLACGWDEATGHVGITRTRGTYTDPFASGEEPVFTLIRNNPFPLFPRAWLSAGTVHTCERLGKPTRLIMAALLGETREDGANYGSCHVLFSDDYLNWTYGGEIWRYAIDKAWFLGPDGPRDLGPYPLLNAGSTLLHIPDEGGPGQDALLFPVCGQNGPLGPGQTADALFGLSWAKVNLAVLNDALDVGLMTHPLVTKWHNGGWNSLYDGPASSVLGADMPWAWVPHVVWCYELGLYLCVGQSATTEDGNAIWISYAPSPLGPWSPRQLLHLYRGPTPQWYCACPTVIAPSGTVGREFDLWYEVWTEGEGITDYRVGTESVTIQLA